MCVVFILFEVMSGLKVNFYKSLLVGANVNEYWLNGAALVVTCKIRCLPFVYLDLCIGGDVRHLIFWDPLLNRTKA